MSAATRNQILNRLKTAGDIDGVSVVVSEGRKTVHVNHEKERVLGFKFVWLGDHFAGYFVDCEGQESHAVISIWEPLDAIQFVTSYSLLAGLRASRKTR